MYALVHLVLGTHGFAMLLFRGGEFWQWLLIGLVAAIGVFGLVEKRFSERILPFGALYLLPIAWVLMLSTGGTASFFLLWYFVLVSTFSGLGAATFGWIYPLLASLSYLALIPFTEQSLPLMVLSSRAFLLLSIGLIIRELALSTERGNTRLQISESRLSNILNTARDAIISLDENQNIILFNQGAQHIFGYEVEDVMHQSLDILIPGDLIETHQSLVEGFSRSSFSLHRMAERRERVMGRRKDGSLFPIEASYSKHNENGQLVFTSIVRDITHRKIDEDEIHRAHANLTLAYDETLEGWVRALALKDDETEGHTRRVTDMTLRLARFMACPEDEMLHIGRGALLHDVGKVGIPDRILQKQGPLNDEEWEIMKLHPTYAYKFISPIEYLRAAVDIPACHHEKWDGTGYPNGIKGEDIPLAARIFAIVDVFDALSSDRPYRKAWSSEKIDQYLFEQSRKHFDPNVVDSFFLMRKKDMLSHALAESAS